MSSLCAGLKDLGADYMTLFTGTDGTAARIYENAGCYNELITGWSGIMSAYINASEQLKKNEKKQNQTKIEFGD